MEKQDFFKKLALSLGRAPEDISEEQYLISDLDADSMSMLVFLMYLEDYYKIKIPAQAMLTVERMTVGDFYSLALNYRG